MVVLKPVLNERDGIKQLLKHNHVKDLKFELNLMYSTYNADN